MYLLKYYIVSLLMEAQFVEKLKLTSHNTNHHRRVINSVPRSSHDWTFDPRRVQLATAGPVAIQNLA